MKKDAKAATTITGASTVQKRPLAYNDRAVTSMVPAAVLVRREAAAKRKPNPKDVMGAGFGLAPMQKKAVGAAGGSSGGGGLGGLKVPGPAGISLPGPSAPRFAAPAGYSSVVVAAPGADAAAAANGDGGGVKPKGVDDKLASFMDSLKDLGAFD